MEIIKKFKIDGILLLKTSLHNDERGSFIESFSKKLNLILGQDFRWLQDNESFSKKNVFRGLHFQKGINSQSKLLRVSHGKILDILVDLRKDSKTFKKYITVKLDSRNLILFIPKGIAHGFLSLSNNTIVNYKCDNEYNPKSESGINPFISKLDINWGVNDDEIIISDKDASFPSLDDSYVFE